MKKIVIIFLSLLIAYFFSFVFEKMSPWFGVLKMSSSNSRTLFVNYQNETRHAQGWSSNFYAEGVQASANVNSVIGWQSAALPTSNTPWMGGNNVVLLDGARANYGVQIDGTGQLMIKDVGAGDANSGQSITVTGASYAIFNGGTTASPGVYSQIMMIQKGDDATLARMYESSFGRMPDPVGYEGWKAQLDSGQMSLQKIAQSFAQSSEFQSLFGANSTDQQYVDALYTNVLGRAADKAGEAGYTAYLGSIEQTMGVTAARASLLVAFAQGQEEVRHSSSWLVDPTRGGFADSAVPIPTQTVLDQAATSGTLDLSLVNSISGTTQSSNYTSAPNGLATNGYRLKVLDAPLTGQGAVDVGQSGSTIILSKSVPDAFVDGSNNVVHGSSHGGVIVVQGINNTVVMPGGSGNIVQLWELGFTPSFANTIIQNFTSGLDTIEDPLLTLAAVFQGKQYVPPVATILDASSGHTFSGSALSFSGSSAYVLKLGNVGDGSVSEVASAMTKVYSFSNVGGTQNNPYGGEHMTVIGQTSSGNTVVYDLVNWSPTGYGAVTTSDLHLTATLVGVNTAAMVAHDF